MYKGQGSRVHGGVGFILFRVLTEARVKGLGSGQV